MIGKRVPWRTDYTIGFDNYGKLLGQKMMNTDTQYYSNE